MTQPSLTDTTATLPSSPIFILFTCDDGYVPVVHLALKSLFINNPDEQLDVHILTDGLSDASVKKLNALADYFGRTLTIDTISEEDLRQVDLPIITGSQWGKAATLRLMIGHIYPQQKRLLYVDGDVIFCRSVRELWETDLEGNILGAVHDVISFQKRIYKTLGYPNTYGYYNSGVLLIDLDKWREANLDTVLLQTMQNAGPEQMEYPDQNAINMVLYDRIKPLPRKFNVQAYLFFHFHRNGKPWYDDQDEALREPVIFHFSGGNKPWLIYPTDYYKPQRYELALHYIKLPPYTEGLIEPEVRKTYVKEKKNLSLRQRIKGSMIYLAMKLAHLTHIYPFPYMDRMFKEPYPLKLDEEGE
jgi:lipopolysaccharide biosynthesis glycosyltransferase